MAIEKFGTGRNHRAGLTATTLELLTRRAPSLDGRGRRLGAETADHAAALGEYGATTVYDVATSERLPGVPVASAIAALVAAGNARTPSSSRPPTTP